MKSLSILLGLAAAAGVVAAPTSVETTAVEKRNTPNSSGTNNGYYYQFWSTGEGDVTYTNGAAGEYSVKWNGDGDFTAGKGWNPGSARVINYSGSYTSSSSGSLAVYGWTTSPLVEYYIMEDYPGNPSSGLTYKGTVNSDGATYNIYEHTQTNQPSIQGTATFQQYISIRQSKRTSGSVTTANHFNAWKSLGMNLGTFNYQIVSTESWSGTGSSSITVS